MGSLFSILPMLRLHHSTWRALGLKSRRHWAIETDNATRKSAACRQSPGTQLKSDGEEVTSQLFRDRRPHTPSPPRSEPAAPYRSEQGASWQGREVKSSDSNHGFRSLGKGRPGKGLALLLCIQILSLIFWAAG